VASPTIASLILKVTLGFIPMIGSIWLLPFPALCGLNRYLLTAVEH
jgi:hypothetical protein